MNTNMKENNTSNIVELNLEQLEYVAGGISWEDVLDFILTSMKGVPD